MHKPVTNSARSFLAACLLTLAGCNDEVFVTPLPDMEPVTLSAQGDSLTIDTGVKGALELNLTSESDAGITAIYKLDACGDTVGSLADAAVALPGGLAIESEAGCVRILATTAGCVTIISGPSTTATGISLYLNIVYRHGAVSVPLSVEAIEPYTIDAIEYPDGSFAVIDDETMERVETMRYTNNGSDTVTVHISPYHNALTHVRFTLFSDQPRVPVAQGKEIPLPTVDAGGDAQLNGFTGPYLPDCAITLPSRMPEVQAAVKLPPKSTRRYHTFIKRRTAGGYYHATLISPSLPQAVSQTGYVTVDCPTGYLITYNEDPCEPCTD